MSYEAHQFHVRWIRVGSRLLARTPIRGKRAYQLPSGAEKKHMHGTSWEPTDYELWGGHPNEIMTDYVGKPAKTNAELAGFATVPDMLPSDWDPERDGKLNLGISRTSLSYPRDHLTFSTRELVSRYHQTKGQATIVCGYCEAKLKSRDLQKLQKWFRLHPCISPYASASRD